MKYFGAILFVCLMPVFSFAATEMEFYYCHGQNLELTFFQTESEEEDLLSVEIGGRKIKTKSPITLETDGALHIFAQTPRAAEFSSIHFELKKMMGLDEEIKGNDVTFKYAFATSIVLATKESVTETFDVICEAFELTEEFFDNLAACIP